MAQQGKWNKTIACKLMMCAALARRLALSLSCRVSVSELVVLCRSNLVLYSFLVMPCPPKILNFVLISRNLFPKDEAALLFANGLVTHAQSQACSHMPLFFVDVYTAF